MRASLLRLPRPLLLGLPLAIALLAGVALGREASSPQPAAGSFRAVLWQQTSAEWRGLSLQAYRSAIRSLDAALRDPCWTADPAQVDDPCRRWKRPAVVLDVDETVLDNAAFQARLLSRTKDDPKATDAFDPAAWHAWVAERRAPAVPGAVEFLRYAASRGVAVFYVTNRDDEDREATVDNLRRVGLLADTAHVLTRNDGDGRPLEKSSRRAAVARSHRILLLVGDDLGDFVQGARRVPAAERRRLLERHAAWVGERWIVLANPIYGSWTDGVAPDPWAALETEGALAPLSGEPAAIGAQ